MVKLWPLVLREETVRTLRCGGRRWCRHRVSLNTRRNNRLSALAISSSMSRGVLHKLRFSALRKRALILHLSLLDNWPAKDGSAYVITDCTIEVKIKCRVSGDTPWYFSKPRGCRRWLAKERMCSTSYICMCSQQLYIRNTGLLAETWAPAGGARASLRIPSKQYLHHRCSNQYGF